MIKRHSIEKVLDTAQVDEVVGEYVDLKRRGVNLIGLCPFHNEKTPSFTVSPTKNIYKCFGCGKGGNPVNFLMEHEGFNFPEAIRFLAQRYGIELDETERTPEAIEKDQERDSLYIINEYAKDFFQDQLMNSDEGRKIGYSYFKQRGYLQSTIEEFQLGYCPKSGSELLNYARKKNLNTERMQEMGLFNKKMGDMYRERVVFPIFNLSGKVLGFGARILKEEKKAPKYLNSPETEIYHKSDCLYGIFQAKKEISAQDLCYLVEGYTDVLTMHQAGLKNCVSSSGTALTEGQVRLMRRFSKNLCLIFDGDAAGIKAAKRGLPIALSQDMNIRVATLPEGKDPDTMVRELGKGAFSKFLENEAKDLVLQLLSWNYLDKTDPAEKSVGLKEVLVNLSQIIDTLKRAFYITEVAKLTGMSEEILHKEVNKIIFNRINENKKKKQRSDSADEDLQQKTRSTREKPEVKDSFSERQDHLGKSLVQVLVKYGDREIEWQEKKTYVSYILMESIEELLPLIEDDNMVQFLQLARKRHQQTEPVGLQFFTRQNDEKIVQMAVDLSEDPYSLSKNWEEKYDYPLQSQPMPEDNIAPVIKQILLRFKLRALKKLSAQNKTRIQSAQKDSDLMKCLKIQKHIDEQRKTVAEALNSVVL